MGDKAERLPLSARHHHDGASSLLVLPCPASAATTRTHSCRPGSPASSMASDAAQAGAASERWLKATAACTSTRRVARPAVPELTQDCADHLAWNLCTCIRARFQCARVVGSFPRPQPFWSMHRRPSSWLCPWSVCKRPSVSSSRQRRRSVGLVGGLLLLRFPAYRTSRRVCVVSGLSPPSAKHAKSPDAIDMRMHGRRGPSPLAFLRFAAPTQRPTPCSPKVSDALRLPVSRPSHTFAPSMKLFQ